MIVWIGLALATITLEAPAQRGEETVVLVLDEAGHAVPGETVRVVHRPGLSGERELAIGITDQRGRTRWTPAEGGVARLRAGDEALPLHIQAGDGPVVQGAPSPTIRLLTGLWFGLAVFVGLVSLFVGLRGRRS